VTGADTERIVKASDFFLSGLCSFPKLPFYGNGNASEQIVYQIAK